jgi:hypothetical protein
VLVGKVGSVSFDGPEPVGLDAVDDSGAAVAPD